MRALLLDGSREADGPALRALHETIVGELEACRWEVQAMRLSEMDIAPCRGCMSCWIKTPGLCVQDDAGRDVLKALVASDLAVFLTPVIFGGYSPELKKALDRCLGFALPVFIAINGETHHPLRYNHSFRALALGVLPEADEEAERLFATLVGRNAVAVHAPAHAAGVVLGGQGAEEVREKVRALLAQVEVTR